ncbi:MAG: tyrosine-type recombinase/integrase [Melioribacteraceae bacterium]|nr:MAG: tyrosine-type recombinase/integrase [Melioribacteraceae bacterium]
MSEPVISKTIDEFLSDLENVRRYSDNTISAYRKDLIQFIDFLNERNIDSICQISEKVVRQYLINLNKSELSKSSISRKLSSLRSYFDFIVENFENSTNPVKKISNPKHKRKLPSIINLDSYDEIIKLLSEDDDVFRRNLNTAIFELLYGSSLRVSELCSIKMNDIDITNKTIKVLGKGSKFRIVPLGNKSIQLIERYIHSRNQLNNTNFLVDQTGNSLDRWYVYRVVKKYLSKVTDIEKKSPHVLRHSSATEMLNRGADLMAVKEILGHENLSTTQIYTHVSVEKLKKSYKSAHPKS